MQRSCLKSSRYIWKNCQHANSQQHMHKTTTVPDIDLTVHTTPERMSDQLIMGWLPTGWPRATHRTSGTLSHPVRDHQGQSGGRQRPIAARWDEARRMRGTSAALSTAADGKKCRPNTDCNISDAVRWGLTAYCCNQPSSMRRDCRHVEVATQHEVATQRATCSHSAGGQPSRRADSGAPTHSRNWQVKT